MRIALITLTCAAVLISSAAYSFQEQRSGAASAPAGETPAASPGPAPTPELGLENAVPTTPTPAGTEVRIPGLGKLGVLPKMDFGLELLYGAAEPKQPESQRDPAATPEDLTIRGTVKHNF